MTDLVFVDTNILIYAHDRDAGVRRDRAAAALGELWTNRSGRLSVQVLQEFYVTATSKLRSSIDRASAREVVRSYSSWVGAAADVGLVLRAIEIAELARLSYWDAMIVAAAEQCGASTLYTEDLNTGQSIAGIHIVNPLASSPA